MKKIFVAGLLTLLLGGCAGTMDYAKVIKTPPPQGLDGVWMSDGPQRALVSPEAIASLIITRSGDTLDCRQWQRTIARQGKLYWQDGKLFNVNVKNENHQLVMTNGMLHYDGLSLRRVASPTVECQAYLTKVDGAYLLAIRPAPKLSAPHTDKPHKRSGVQMRNSKD
ncbi:lipoprotein YedD [Martelella alba]|uniref:Lipoprotein n=1 Tax=Martelella alba TaxID=2590451 RepID=A0ABY2SMA0_9HYPH|nr:lipoprotein YedD [Martelella alba]TKI05493.1 lipoprotein [Martelella alba]